MKKSISIMMITAIFLSMTLSIIPVSAAPSAQVDALINTAALESAIKEAEKLMEENYTSNSWAVFEIVFNSAISALNSNSQKEVDSAVARKDKEIMEI